MSAVLFNFAGEREISLAENRSLLVASRHVICHIKDVSGTILWRKESERSKNERNESDGSGFWNKRTEKMRWNGSGKRTPTFQESTMVSEINIHA